MRITVDTLLAGPVGRHLLLLHALASEERTTGNGWPGGPLTQAVRGATDRLEALRWGPGGFPGTGHFVIEASDERLSTAVAGDHQVDFVSLEAVPGYSPSPSEGLRSRPLTEAEVATRHERIAAEGATAGEVNAALLSTELIAPTPLSLHERLAHAVSVRRPWQPDDGEDELVADAALDPGLRRVAAFLLEASGTDPAVAEVFERWAAPADPAEQFAFNPRFEEAEQYTDRDGAGASERLTRWRDAAPHGGQWTTTPAYEIPTTFGRSVGITGDGGASHGRVPYPANLEEDAWRDDAYACTHRPPAPGSAPRVLEIGGREHWAELVRTHPLSLGRGYGGDWPALPEGATAWVTLDFAAMARGYDAVHLSIAAHLATATCAFRVGDVELPDAAGDVVTVAAATYVAGWDPDATLWFSDDALLPEEEGVGESLIWRRDQDTGLWSPDFSASRGARRG